jgi:RHS repeat-associated protein
MLTMNEHTSLRRNIGSSLSFANEAPQLTIWSPFPMLHPGRQTTRCAGQHRQDDVLPDHTLGSVLASFSNVANSAAIQGNQVFGPYGNARDYQGTINTAKGFTGQYTDSLTGLDYYQSRYYDQVAGVFLSADVVQGNGSGENPYAYVWVPTFLPPKIPAKAPARSRKGLNKAGSPGSNIQAIFAQKVTKEGFFVEW